jgi:hypothetical protein
MFENWNSLGIFSHSWKMERLNHMVTDLHVDIVAGCETQCDWSLVPPHRQFLQVLCPGTTKVGLALNNVTETITCEQMGGTALAAIGRLGDVVLDKGCDRTGLAQWTWLTLGNGVKTTRVVCGYLPCKPCKIPEGIRYGSSIQEFFRLVVTTGIRPLFS